MTLPKHPSIGQRWKRHGTVKTYEVVEVYNAPRDGALKVRLVLVDATSGRRFETKRSETWQALIVGYEHLGDFFVPEGYSVHKAAFVGGHCYRDPSGHVEGAPAGERWTWTQARDAAVQHARSTSTTRQELD